MFKNQWAQPGLHELMKELRAILDEYDGDRMLVGEDDNIAYMGNGEDELHLVFNFPSDADGTHHTQPYPAQPKGAFVSAGCAPGKRLALQHAWQPRYSRIHTRYGDKQHDAELARLHAALVLTLKGTPFLYNGEEIGMTDLIITDPTKLRDTMATWYYDRLVNELKVDPRRSRAPGRRNDPRQEPHAYAVVR